MLRSRRLEVRRAAESESSPIVSARRDFVLSAVLLATRCRHVPQSHSHPHRTVGLAIRTGLDGGVIRRLTSKKFDFQRQEIRTRRDKTGAMLTIPIPDAIGSLVFARSVRQSTSVSPAALWDRPCG